MSGSDCVIEIPMPDLIWVPVLTSTPILTSKHEHEQNKTSEGALVNESSHHASQVLDVPSRLDSGISMSSGRTASTSSGGPHPVSLISSLSSVASDSAYGSPYHVTYGINAFWNAQDEDFWPRPLREEAPSARLPERPSDVSELLKHTVFLVLLALMILAFMIFIVFTARNYALMTASLSMGLIVLLFIVHQFYYKVVELCTRPRANVPLVVYNRANLPQIIIN